MSVRAFGKELKLEIDHCPTAGPGWEDVSARVWQGAQARASRGEETESESESERHNQERME